MEMTPYASPQSWDDKGMTWNANMNIADINYSVALREAVLERISVTSKALYGTGLRMPGNCVPLRYDFLCSVRNVLCLLAPYFINLEYQSTKDDFSDAPKCWSYRELNTIPSCRICELPPQGSPAPAMIQWMIHAKNYLDRLTVIKATVTGIETVTDASIHDPPFSEAINTAMQLAVDNVREKDFSGSEAVIWAWSGNTHYKREPNGYCGYASLRSLSIKKQLLPNSQIHAGLLVSSYSYIDKTPVSYSTFLQSGIYDSADTGFLKDEFKITNHGLFENGNVKLGCNVASIPKNYDVPSSTWGETVIKNSKKRGFWSKIQFFSDFGVDGGFKFRS